MESKRGRPTAAESAERTTRIAIVVTRILAQGGFDELTFDRVSAEARVAKRTLYRDYVDRGGLVRAAVRRLHDAAGALGDLTPTDPPAESLRDYAISLVSTLLSDDAIGVHRAVISAAARYPEVAAAFYAEGPSRSVDELAALLKSMPNETWGSSGHSARPMAELLFAALTGEPHRRRLLGLTAAPDGPAVARHIGSVLATLNLEAGSSRG